MRQIRFTIIAVVMALTICSSAQAVTLVGLNGSPVAGSYQMWANRMKTPSVNMQLLMLDPAICGSPAAAGCAWGPPFHVYPGFGNTYGIAATSEATLQAELGHIFDWKYFDSVARSWFASMWGQPNAPWVDSAAGLNRGVEDGLEGAFELAYMTCAQGNTTPTHMSWSAGTPVIAFDHSTCDLITAIGQRNGATMQAGFAADRGRISKSRLVRIAKRLIRIELMLRSKR